MYVYLTGCMKLVKQVNIFKHLEQFLGLENLYQNVRLEK